MKKYILTLFFTCTLLFLKSQVAYFKVVTFTDSVSSPGIKKYGVKMSFPGLNLPLTYKVVDNISGLEYTGDSISNIFNSNTINRVVNCYAFEPGDSINAFAIAQINPAKKTMIEMGQLTSTTGTNCDGEIKVNIDTIGVGYIGQEAYYGILSSSGVLTNQITVGTNTISGLCSHKYVVLVNAADLSGPWPSYPWVEETTILIGHYAFPAGSTYSVSVDVLAPTSGAICVGEAKVRIAPTPPQPPTFSLDGAAFNNIDSITNLCAGYHFINVATLTDTIGKTFFINTVSDTITNPNHYGVAIDTIIYSYNNCNFNYSNPIDSAFISNYLIISNNMVFVEWQIWNAGIVTQVSDTINYSFQTGNNMISLYMYCTNAQKSTQGYKAKKINDFRLFDNSGTAGIKSNILSYSKIFPNPFEDEIYIQTASSENIYVELKNVIGETLNNKIAIHKTTQGNFIIDTSLLSKGIYFMTISDSNNRNSAKLIKN